MLIMRIRYPWPQPWEINRFVAMMHLYDSGLSPLAKFALQVQAWKESL